MRAVLLGTGSPPPNPKRRGPATLLTLGGEQFLVDAGSGVGAQLVLAGVRPYDWPRVLITHHHSDHIIDIGHLLITRWISGQNAPFEVWGPAGTKRQMDKLLDYLDWDIEIRPAHMVKRERPKGGRDRDRRGQGPGGGRRDGQRLQRGPRPRQA